MLKLTRRAFTALALAATLASPALAQEAFPVTLTHVFGDTTIEAAPQRIVTIGWMSQDAVLALGQVPVAIPEQMWGGDAQGVLPWVREAIDGLGGPEPKMVNFDTDIPYEELLALNPDLILAPYSGVTQEQYDRLSAIAPTVAYAKDPWAASWQDVMLTTGKALGKTADAEALIAATDKTIADAAAANPEFAGKTFTFGSLWVGSNGMNVYAKTDPRVYLVEQLGLVASAGVEELSKQPGYYFEVSWENLDQINADVIISLDEGDEASDALYAQDVFQRLAPVAEGHLLRMTDKGFVMATSAPSVVSIPWMLDRFVPELAATLAK
ncbi:MAG: iron-siderophore ABC transporter substrate-binding protein [Devosia sp.]